MRVMVTGATGFVGRYVVKELLNRGHSIIAVSRNVEKANQMDWINDVNFIQCDLHENFMFLFDLEKIPDAIVHLAWPGLQNYCDFLHVSQYLPADIAFLEAAVNVGVSQLIVAGTCLEYGMQYGPLGEEMETSPITPYGFAKDALYKSLQLLGKEKKFTLQWMRLFYLFGEGQNQNSLLAQLDRAIDEKKDEFNMSMGSQLRDYLSIHEVAENFGRVVEAPACNGIINCCSGVPVSVLDLVKQRCLDKSSNIQLNRGYYPYPEYEPLAFWGIPRKLSSLNKPLIKS